MSSTEHSTLLKPVVPEVEENLLEQQQQQQQQQHKERDMIQALANATSPDAMIVLLRKQLKEAFQKSQGRAPSEEEIDQLLTEMSQERTGKPLPPGALAASKQQRRLPVTLLSGFLGAGKTTLLKRILQDRGHGMKIAVVVNDMGALNIDADEIKNAKLVKEKAQMVEFHNGCICCTLRGDLLKTVKELSEEMDEETGKLAWEYLVIESTGISEPLPIAQTFVMDVNSFNACDPNGGQQQNPPAIVDPDKSQDKDNHADPNGGQQQNPPAIVDPDKSQDKDNHAEEGFVPLSQYARLDTLVTVVDLYNILHVLGGDQDDPGEKERLLGEDDVKQKQEEGQPASLYQLLVDQLEFANVILLNKVDLIHSEDPVKRHELVMRVGRLVRKFNPDAELLVPGYQFNFTSGEWKSEDTPASGRLTKSKFAEFDLNHVLNTGKFNMEKAQMGAGWISELQKDLSGVGHTPETEEYGIGSFVWRTSPKDPRPFHPTRLSDVLHGFGRIPGQQLSTEDLAEKVADAAKKEQEGDVREDGSVVLAEEGPFMGVVRSKGHLWLSYAHAMRVDFHTAGRQLSLSDGNPFLDAIPRKYWNQGAANQFQQLMMTGKWHLNKDPNGYEFGDRSSVLVIIGVDMDANRKRIIREALNSALLTDKEMAVGIQAFNEAKQKDKQTFVASCQIDGQTVNIDTETETETEDSSGGGTEVFFKNTVNHPWRDYGDPFFNGTGPDKMWALKFSVPEQQP